MADFPSRVIALSQAAWKLRRAAPRPSSLPFALALFTDPSRMPELREVAAALPPRNGDDLPPLAIIFRHDALPPGDRLKLAEDVCREVQDRGHLFIMARRALPGADGLHGVVEGLRPDAGQLWTAPVHDEDEIVAAIQAGAGALFLSPINKTASHTEQSPLPRRRAIALAQASPAPIFALGGMDEKSIEPLIGSPFQGIGAIDAFFPKE